MISTFNRRLLIDQSKLFYKDKKLQYSSNPVALNRSDSQIRIFFNSRDLKNRSSIFSIDMHPKTLEPNYETVTLQHSHGTPDSYFSEGISIGQMFSLHGEKCISIMGWKNPDNEHWQGRIGYIRIDRNANLDPLPLSPWMDLDNKDPISLSYPAIFEQDDTTFIWYGSTCTWDAGNGEMLHILKEAILTKDGEIVKSDIAVPYLLGSAQAFSRPAVIEIGTDRLMAYSYRGSNSKYRIGFMQMGEVGSASHLGGIPAFLPTSNPWESEMVEYPSFFYYSDQLFMLYNGNSFGKTGIGVVNINHNM